MNCALGAQFTSKTAPCIFAMTAKISRLKVGLHRAHKERRCSQKVGKRKRKHSYLVGLGLDTQFCERCFIYTYFCLGIPKGKTSDNFCSTAGGKRSCPVTKIQCRLNSDVDVPVRMSQLSLLAKPNILKDKSRLGLIPYRPPWDFYYFFFLYRSFVVRLNDAYMSPSDITSSVYLPRRSTNRIWCSACLSC